MGESDPLNIDEALEKVTKALRAGNRDEALRMCKSIREFVNQDDIIVSVRPGSPLDKKMRAEAEKGKIQ